MNLALPNEFLDTHFPYSELQGLEKLAVLVAMAKADLVGFTVINRETFEDGYGISVEVLDSAIAKLDEEAVVVFGERYWFSRMVFEQYGGSDGAVRRNSMFGTLVKLLVKKHYPHGFLDRFFQEYPLFKPHFDTLKETGVEPINLSNKKKESKSGRPQRRISKQAREAGYGPQPEQLTPPEPVKQDPDDEGPGY